MNTLIAALLCLSLPRFAQANDVDKWLKKAQSAVAQQPVAAGLGDEKLAAGLKEALRVGTEKAVKLTARKDGYFGDAAIKILMPQKAQTLEKGLRKLGFGRQTDEFILSMNRAAEKAAPAARGLFVDALASMTVEDARKIYEGGDTSATEYFQGKTRVALVDAYKPIVRSAMKDFGVTEKYQSLTGKIPFAGLSAKLNVEDHVVGKALDGLFKTLGDQEREIRRNPAARVTNLLKEVFASR